MLRSRPNRLSKLIGTKFYRVFQHCKNRLIHSVISRCGHSKITYSQVPNKRPPPLITFRIFSIPRTLVGPPVYYFMEIDFFTNLSLHFPSLLVPFTSNFHVKIACFCIYFSFMFYGVLLLFFLSLYNHLKPLLKVQSLIY